MGQHRYGVILDAGSSGTRVHIYSWLKSNVARSAASGEALHTLPRLNTKNKKWTMKVHTGVASFGFNVDLVGHDHLKDLLDFALDVVPKDEVQDTPFFFLATAGMRMLDTLPQKALLDEICRYTKATTNFLLPDCAKHVQVISGETEGLYGWIATNYLAGGFDQPDVHEHGKGHHTYGFLDMGGASAQMAFVPNSTEIEKHGNDLKLLRLRTLDGEQNEYCVFVTTFLGYGANEARRRYVDAMVESIIPGDTKALPDPCLPSGLEVTKEGGIIQPGSPEEQGLESYLFGTGKFEECLAQTYPLLDKEASCADPPCLFHGIHVPAIDYEINRFIGVSNFWHSTHDIFDMGHKDAAYNFQVYQARVMEFCSKTWDSIEQDIEDKKWDGTEEEDAAETCFKAAWLINVLHVGIGIPRVGLEGSTGDLGDNGGNVATGKPEGYLLPFQAVNKINDTELSWTLGKMLLFASSQIPPASVDSLAVGFGSNSPGIPEDFEHAGGQIDQPVVEDNGPDVSGDPSSSGSGADLYDDATPDKYPIDDSKQDANERINLHHLLNADNLRRTPGFILFLVILAVVGILLCGRERRANLGRKIADLCCCRKSRGGAIQLGRKANVRRLPFGLGGSRREPKYDQLMEEGDIPNPQDFELHNISGSDDDKASQSSKASSSSQNSVNRKNGSATPRRPPRMGHS